MKCPDCQTEYETELEILACLQKHESEPDIKNECFVCSAKHETKEQLLEHLQGHGVTIRQCPECLARYESEDEMYACMDKHMQATCKHEEAEYSAVADNKKLFVKMECEECQYEDIKTLNFEDHDELRILYGDL